MMQKPKRYVTKSLRDCTTTLKIEIESMCNAMLKTGCILNETITIPVVGTRAEVILIFAEY